MTGNDASFRTAGYVLTMDDNPHQKIQTKRKTYSCLAFGSNIFSPVQLKTSFYSTIFLTIYMSFLEFAHILWQATRPTVVRTEKRSVKLFFQTRAIPSVVWKHMWLCVPNSIQNSTVSGSVNTTADFLSRLELKITEKTHLRIRKTFKQHPLSRQYVPRSRGWRTILRHSGRKWERVRGTDLVW